MQVLLMEVRSFRVHYKVIKVSQQKIFEFLLKRSIDQLLDIDDALTNLNGRTKKINNPYLVRKAAL